MTSPGGVLPEADGLGDSDFAEGLSRFVGKAGFVVSELASVEFATDGFRSAEFLGEVDRKSVV